MQRVVFHIHIHESKHTMLEGLIMGINVSVLCMRTLEQTGVDRNESV
jgi:hypothetical protein